MVVHSRATVEVLPTRFLHLARDLSELAASRLLAEPCFIEAPGRKLATRAIHGCRRLDRNAWEVELSDRFCWDSGERVTATDLARQIQRARDSRAAATVPTLLLRELEVISEFRLAVRTRVPIAHLDRILANPGLSPSEPDGGRRTGNYSIAARTRNSLTFNSNANDASLVLLRQSARRMAAGQIEPVDFTGPMDLSPAQWGAGVQRPGAYVTPLDVLYLLILPRSFPPETCREIDQFLDRARIVRSGQSAVLEARSLVAAWHGQGLGEAPLQRRPHFCNHQPELELFYADFPTNCEIASATAEALAELGLAVRVVKTPYSTLRDHRKLWGPQQARLVLAASPWPHPASMLSSFYFAASAGRRFRQKLEASLSAADLDVAAAHAVSAERELRFAGLNIIALGQAMGCFWSRSGSRWIPPSGWLSYAPTADTDEFS